MSKLKEISEVELSQILSDHKLWLDSKYKEGNRALLSNTNLHDANLSEADLRNADLSGANLRGADLKTALLTNTDLKGANLIFADLGFADLSGANLTLAGILFTIFKESELSNCIFNSSIMGATNILDVDLSEVKELETVKHQLPSSISIDTIIRSNGKIPKVFLRGCGVPDEWIDYIPSLTGQAIQYYSCFISYSHKDEEFAQKLYGDLQNAGIRCWYAPEEMKGGKKLHDQIFDAIKLHDKLVLILSENSMKSEWVKTEIRRTRKTEKESGKQKLFPISLVDYQKIKEWECFDAEIGKDIGVEIREYYIPDFTDWKNHDAYKKEFDKLVKALKTESANF